MMNVHLKRSKMGGAIVMVWLVGATLTQWVTTSAMAGAVTSGGSEPSVVSTPETRPSGTSPSEAPAVSVAGLQGPPWSSLMLLAPDGDDAMKIDLRLAGDSVHTSLEEAQSLLREAERISAPDRSSPGFMANDGIGGGRTRAGRGVRASKMPEPGGVWLSIVATVTLGLSGLVKKLRGWRNLPRAKAFRRRHDATRRLIALLARTQTGLAPGSPVRTIPNS